MRLLLDTHAFLWFVTDNPSLSASARSVVGGRGNEVSVSPASYWEIAIKVSLGEYPMAVPFAQFFDVGIAGNDFAVLPIGVRRAHVLASLPLRHRDPFDRMVIAQATSEPIPVVSVDAASDSYGVKRLW